MLVSCKVRDFKMMVDSEDKGMSTHLLKGVNWEGDAPDILSRIVKPGAIVLELGACLGYYMIIEALAGGQVYAVEPEPNNVEIMKINTSLNKLTNVKIFQMAIDGENGEKKFRRTPQRSDGGRLSPSEEGIDVKTMTLDTFVKKNIKKPLDVLRCDIEGSEVAMIREGQETLQKMPKGSWIFIDLHPVRFKRPYIPIRRMVENIIQHGFVPKHMNKIDPTKITTARFLDACCKPTFPKVFFRKEK